MAAVKAVSLLGLAITVLVASALSAPADAVRQVPASKTEELLSFAPVVRKAAPAVVNVYASRTDVQPRNPLFDDPVFRRFFGEGNAARPGGATAKSLGSGVLVDPSGLIVTNYHVIDGMTDVKVALSDQRELDADIVLRDQRTDLAVLKLKGGGTFPTMELGDSDALEVGDIALAIGDPFGVGQTVTQGIISALARTNVGHVGLRLLHPDGCRHQPRQFRRRARRHARAAGRHQLRHLLAIGRLGRHRLRDPRQHGQGGGGSGQERRQAGAPALARRQPAGGDARHRGVARPAAPDGRARLRAERSRPGGGCGDQARRRDHGDRRQARGQSRRASASASPPSRSAARRSSPCGAAAR